MPFNPDILAIRPELSFFPLRRLFVTLTSEPPPSTCSRSLLKPLLILDLPGMTTCFFFFTTRGSSTFMMHFRINAALLAVTWPVFLHVLDVHSFFCSSLFSHLGQFTSSSGTGRLHVGAGALRLLRA